MEASVQMGSLFIYADEVVDNTIEDECNKKESSEDVNLLEEELEVYENPSEILVPIIQETEWSEEDCDWYQYMACYQTKRKRRRCNALKKHSKKKTTRKLVEELITGAYKEYEQDGFDATHGIPYWR
ncbi:hypothetical protein Tco_0129536, partial [Tanacetum coccineum]